MRRFKDGRGETSCALFKRSGSYLCRCLVPFAKHVDDVYMSKDAFERHPEPELLMRRNTGVEFCWRELMCCRAVGAEASRLAFDT